MRWIRSDTVNIPVDIGRSVEFFLAGRNSQDLPANCDFSESQSGAETTPATKASRNV